MTHERFSFGDKPDIGNELLRRSYRLKFDLTYQEPDGDDPQDRGKIFADYEVHGSIAVELAGDSEGPTFLRELLTAFRTTERRAEA